MQETFTQFDLAAGELSIPCLLLNQEQNTVALVHHNNASEPSTSASLPLCGSA